MEVALQHTTIVFSAFCLLLYLLTLATAVYTLPFLVIRFNWKTSSNSPLLITLVNNNLDVKCLIYFNGNSAHIDPDIEQLNNNLHGLLPPGGFASLLFDQEVP